MRWAPSLLSPSRSKRIAYREPVVMKQHNLQKIVLRAAMLALSIFSVAALFSACAKQDEATVPTTVETTAVSEPEPTMPEGTINYQGAYYAPKDDLQTVLIMGLDKFEREEQTLAYTNKMQSDFLLLVVIDEEAQTCDLLHLNRDTMTEIPRLGFGGSSAGTFVGQLALAHTYGSGGSDSCLNAVKAVSNFLGGVKIDHYMTLTMDAVGKINDLVGGVTVTMLDDFTDLDPEMEKGKEITLKGDQALLYVRSRRELEDSSNLHRMERQRQYLNAFYEKLMEANRKVSGFLSSTLLKVNDDFESDCTVNQLEELSDLLEKCSVNPIRSLDGEAIQGEEFIEFYADEESVQDAVLSLFYTKVS